MKRIIITLIIAGTVASVRGQIPVTDVAGLLNHKIAQLENIAKWTDSIAKLRAQIDHLKEQVAIQNDIRKWAGNPSEAARRIAMDKLGVGDLVREYGRARAVVVSTANSVASLSTTVNGTYRAIEDIDLNGGKLKRDALAHRRYAVLDAQQQNYQEVVEETKERELDLQEDLAQTLHDIKGASTEAEVSKQAAKVGAINGQIAAVGADRRDQADQVVVQKIANDARLEQERLATAEMEAKNDHLANQRVTSFMRTLKVRRNSL